MSGRFKKVRIKQLKGHGLYRGEGNIEIYNKGIKIVGRHVHSLGRRLAIGFLIWFIVASVLNANIHLRGLISPIFGFFLYAFLLPMLCAIPAYILVEYFILKKEDIFIPWTSLKLFAADPKRKIIGLILTGLKSVALLF